jgi:hypothetical protein
MRADRGCRGADRHVRRDDRAGVAGDLRAGRQAGAFAGVVVGRAGIERPVAGDLRGEAGQRRREVGGRLRRLDVDAGLHADIQPVVGVAEEDRAHRVGEEIRAVGALAGRRVDGERAGDEALAAGDRQRQHAHHVPPAGNGGVVAVADGQFHVVEHARLASGQPR